MVRIINGKDLDDLTSVAQKVSRKRKNFNFHSELSDPINRMLNAFEPGTYVHPHKHEDSDKREVFILLRGRLLMVIFDDSGNVIDRIILDLKKACYAIEIPPTVWHMAISLEPGTVVYEIKDGPYFPEDDKCFAPWAPNEGDNNCQEYLDNLIKGLHI